MNVQKVPVQSSFNVVKPKFQTNYYNPQFSAVMVFTIAAGQCDVNVMSQLRYDSSNRFISRRLISDASFMSVPSIVFKKWRGGV